MELKKQLRFKNGIIKEMTLDEVVMEFKPMVRKLANSWTIRYELDDLIQIGSIGLIKAYKNYDINTTHALFSSYAYPSISNQLSINFRGDKAKEIKFSSLNDLVSGNDSQEEKINLLKDETTNIEEEVLADYQYEQLIRNCTDIEKQVINLYILDHKTQKEISKILDYSQPHINRIFKKTLAKIKRDIANDMKVAL